MSKKRTLDGFFTPTQPKRARVDWSSQQPSNHSTYPFPIPQLPPSIIDALGFAPESEGRPINDQPDLDLLYFQPYIPKEVEKELFQFLRQELPFYRVRYTIKRGPVVAEVNTPRYTTVFGVDDSSCFSHDGTILHAQSRKPIQKDWYRCKPRPIPGCLDFLRKITEGSTGQTYNFCLVNYYASGNDSISFHSDDERFLGTDPAIASFSLGARRDFLMKHKSVAPSSDKPLKAEAKPLKLPLGSGDMVLMRGTTQANWLHSIPKRKAGGSDKGRINITFRKAMVKAGTENYYQYNVGSGHAFKWDGVEMVQWAAS